MSAQRTGTGPAPHSRWILGTGLFLVSLAAGCSLDFDQFDDVVTPTQDDSLPDMSTDMPVTDLVDLPDLSVDMAQPFVLGASCAEDEDCGVGFCRLGMCTLQCSVDEDCLNGVCRELGDELLCAVSCDVNACQVEGNEDLNCVLAADTSGRLGATCLPDSDGDQYSDFEDLCPMVAGSYDTDGDGAGDACDDEVLCHPGLTDGLRTLAAFSFDKTEFSIPDYVEGPRIPMWGGLDADGTISATTNWLDLRTDTWSAGPDLPRPGLEFASAELNGGWLLSFGAETAGDSQAGRLIQVRTGSTEYGEVTVTDVFNPVFGVTGDHVVWMVGYTEAAPGTRWGAFAWNDETQTFDSRGSGNASGTRRNWRVTKDSVGRLHFYTAGRDGENRGYLMRIESGNSSFSVRNINWPDGAYDPFDPFLVPGTGDTLWAIERSDGRVWSISFDAPTPVRAVDLDIDLTVYTDPSFVAFTGGPGFAIIDQAPEGLVAHVFSLACRAAALVMDRDTDTVPDVIDNCVNDVNPMQEALTDDQLGNACDDDDDGDAQPDTLDFILDETGSVVDLSLDTDNDGTDNATDADVDGDGLADAMDRYPMDTDNDAMLNEFDADDDDDGYLDSAEWSLGSSSVDPISLPLSGMVGWVSVDGQSRIVQTSGFLEPSPNTIPFDGYEPHLPRVSQGGGVVVALDGEPGQATQAVWSDGVMATPLDLGGPLRAIDFNEDGLATERFFAIRENADGRWEVIDIDVVSGDEITIYDLVDDVVSLDSEYNVAAFLANPPGCTDCEIIYVTNPLRSLVLGDLKVPRNVKYNGFETSFVAMPDGRFPRGFVASGLTVEEYTPPAVERVDSIVALGVDGHILVSGASTDGTFDVWLYNGLKDRWDRFMTADEDLVELDWTR